MKYRILQILFIGFFVASCGSKKTPVITTTKPKTTVKLPPKEVIKPKKETSETLEATSKVSTTGQSVDEYIAYFKPIAQNNMKQYGIPASIILAQGILESGAGKGRLAIQANNHFGIKCHKGWTGESIKHDDDAAQECFRKYDDAADSYRDHALFLTGRSRYDFLFELENGDYEAWANGLKNAGYATDPKYPSKLIGIIERFGLSEFDKEVLDPNFKKQVVSELPFIAPVEVSLVEAQDGGDYHIVQPKETLYSLSKKYETTVDRIKELNGFTTNDLSIGQRIKIK